MIDRSGGRWSCGCIVGEPGRQRELYIHTGWAATFCQALKNFTDKHNPYCAERSSWRAHMSQEKHDRSSNRIFGASALTAVPTAKFSGLNLTDTYFSVSQTSLDI